MALLALEHAYQDSFWLAGTFFFSPVDCGELVGPQPGTESSMGGEKALFELSIEISVSKHLALKCRCNF